MYRKHINALPNSETFAEPQYGKTVFAHQCCPEFYERGDMYGAVKEFFCCVHASFDLGGDKTPNSGTCMYQQKQS